MQALTLCSARSWFQISALSVLFSAVQMLHPRVMNAQEPSGEGLPPDGNPVAERPAPEKKKDPALPLLSSFGRRNESAMKLFQGGARGEYLTALELKDRGRLREALGRFEDFRVLYPAHPGEPIVVRHIVDIYEKLSLPARALSVLQAFLGPRPPARPGAEWLPLLSARADLEYRLGFWEESLATSRILARLFPADPAADRARARMSEIQKSLTPESPVEKGTEVSPGTAPADSTSTVESSLDRLGEGLDDEK